MRSLSLSTKALELILIVHGVAGPVAKKAEDWKWSKVDEDEISTDINFYGACRKRTLLFH